MCSVSSQTCKAIVRKESRGLKSVFNEPGSELKKNEQKRKEDRDGSLESFNHINLIPADFL